MAPDAAAGQALLGAGRVGPPHGLGGSFHGAPPRPPLLSLGVTVTVNDQPLLVTRLDGTDDKPIMRLEGLESREAVDALRGAELWGPRSAAPPLDDDEWYAEDLERCRVVDGDRPVGVVKRMLP